MRVPFALQVMIWAVNRTFIVVAALWRISLWLFWRVVVPGLGVLAGALIRLAARTASMTERRAGRLS